MTFKELSINQEFEFDYSDFTEKTGLQPLGFALGPWRKISPRKYVYADGSRPYSMKVGTIHAKVTPGPIVQSNHGW